MTLGEIASNYFSAPGGATVIVIAILSIVQFSPIKVDPWTFIAKSIGRAINADIREDLQKLSRDVDLLREKADARAAITSRTRILRFGDELLHEVRHSKEHFDQTLQDITEYEAYCREHPDFVNNMTQLTAKRIKDKYAELLRENDFL